MPLPVFHITGSTTVSEVPYFSASGWMLLNMYDGNNDMQLTQDGGKLEIPMATHLAMLNSNHWDMRCAAPPRGALGTHVAAAASNAHIYSPLPLP